MGVKGDDYDMNERQLQWPQGIKKTIVNKKECKETVKGLKIYIKKCSFSF